MTMRVPFLDLKAQYVSIRTEIDGAIQSVIDETAFVRGRFVRDFERQFAEAHNVRHCVGVANGTDALAVALYAAGIGKGDEVITAANSWIGSAEAATMVGADSVLIDVEPDYFNLNPDLLEAAITSRTRVIMPVHLYGQPAAMNEITAIAAAHDLIVIEDAAQAHLAEIDGKKVGSFGQSATFSFYPGKNLGAYGDAGCVTTDDDDLALRMRMYANHGSSVEDKHDHPFEGVNSRLDGIQAAVLSAKLPHLERWNKERRAKAALYSELLEGVGDIVTPKTRSDATHAFHVYCIRASARDSLQRRLADQGVGTSVHYPIAIPFLGAFAHRGYTRDDFPVAAQYQNEILSLPIYPELSETSIEYVVASIEGFFADQPRTD